MGHEQTYTSVKATYRLENGILSGPKDVEIQAKYHGTDYSLHIEQYGIRLITIEADHPVSWSKLLGPLYCLERLLMIFDGTFIPVTDIEFSGSPFDDNGAIVKEQAIAQRLSYFKTDSQYFNIKDKLVDFQDVLTSSLFDRWQELLEELDIVNQIYLYNLGKSGMPVDLRLSFLTELAEPLVEIVNVKKNLYPSLDPGERGTTLKQCLNALLNTYGDAIFKKEMQSDYDSFLSTLVDSRVRIMHIKRNQKKAYFDGSHSIVYMRKISLLYRRILLEMLDVPYATYKEKLVIRTECIDSWIAKIEK